MQRQIKFINWLFIAAILSITLLLGCVSKENVKTPLSEPMPHPELAQMQSMSIEEKDGVIYFGESKKYQKRGITVVSLKGEPYELGYARGVLLKSEIKSWVRDGLYMIKNHAMGTSLSETLMMNRAKEIETFISSEQLEELKGLSSGSGIEYHTLLMMNVLDTIAFGLRCTSIAVRCADGKILRSRGFEELNRPIFNSWILVITQPDQGNAFASVSLPGLIGVMTAMNNKKVTFGTGAINRASEGWKGMPAWLMNREIIQHADSVEDAGRILEQSTRSVPKVVMITSPDHARVYEYSAEDIKFMDMDKDYLILTNHTRLLNIGYKSPNSQDRYREAESFLTNHTSDMNVKKLVELNRGKYISQSSSPYANSLHSAIFKPETLDFWIAIDPPPASRGRWVGFNLKKELDGSGNEPNPLIIPDMSGITAANIKVNEKEPWTGKWKVESSSRGGGIWAMKQEGDIVESTRDSAYDYKGKVRGNQLKGNIVGASRMLLPFVLEMSSDGMSFQGTADIATSKNNHLKGRRIE